MCAEFYDLKCFLIALISSTKVTLLELHILTVGPQSSEHI